MPLDRFGLRTATHVERRHVEQCMEHQRSYVEFLEKRIGSIKSRRLSDEGNSLCVLDSLRLQLCEEKDSLQWLQSYAFP